MIMRNGAKRCNEVVRVEGKMSVKQTEGNVNSRVHCICNNGCNRNPYRFFCTTTLKSSGVSIGSLQLEQIKMAISSACLYCHSQPSSNPKKSRRSLGAYRKISGQAEGDTQMIRPIWCQDHYTKT